MIEFKTREDYEKWKAQKAKENAAPKKSVEKPAPAPTISTLKKIKSFPAWLKIVIGIVTFLLISSLAANIMLQSASIGIIVMFTIIFIGPVLIYRAIAKKKVMQITCPNCKYEGAGVYKTKGQFCVELILWMLMLVPGLLYSIWRVSSRRWVCPQCDYDHVVKRGYIAA